MARQDAGGSVGAQAGTCLSSTMTSLFNHPASAFIASSRTEQLDAARSFAMPACMRTTIPFPADVVFPPSCGNG
jgi:hypothetical protein